MNKTIISIIAILTLLFAHEKVYSQLSLSYYQSEIPKAGLGCNFSDRAWTELRAYSYTDSTTGSDLGMAFELAFNYNLTSNDENDIYLGTGLNFPYGFFLSVGTQFRPIQNFRRFSLFIDFSPLMEVDNSKVLLRGSGGIRYTFGD